EDVPPPPPVPMLPINLAPVRKSSLGRIIPRQVTMPKVDRTQTSHLSPATQATFHKDTTPRRTPHRQRSASQQSVESHATAISSKSKFSNSNLQDSSVLSMSSSDEECEPEPRRRAAPVRD